MICKEVHKKMNAYLNRELDQKELVDFELHLNDCTSCRHLINEVKQTMQLAETKKVLQADPFMFTRIQAKLENKATKRPIWQKVMQPVLVSMILVIGLFAGVAIGSKYYNDKVMLESNSTETIEQGVFLNEMAYESLELYLLTE